MAFFIEQDYAPARSVRFVLGDHLSAALSSLKDIDAERDLILMAEVAEEARYVPHHPKKIAFIFAAMRHHALWLVAQGYRVRYLTIDAADNPGSFRAVAEAVAAHADAEHLIVTEPGEYRVRADMDSWDLGDCALEVRADDRFICSTQDFARWAEGRKQLRMEFFYREMRKRTGYLMTRGEAGKDEPEGGAWNYDADNRKRIPKDVIAPEPFSVAPDPITEEVRALVRARFASNFGDVEGFLPATTRDGALAALSHFVDHLLPSFGDYQDAMRTASDGDDALADRTLWHSLLSGYMNIGLLDPREVCAAALDRYHRQGDVPLNAIEGFVRQIIGWREYVRGIYWLKMPGYAESNFLGARRKLPEFYWSGETAMHCLSQAIGQTRDLAYAHHIQRLMVTGNFALLYGVRPSDINQWYLAVYMDAFEWVQLPNTHGMVMHADGGYLGSKPYAASGKYIDRMSDYCKHCRYTVKNSTEADACPFNALYWHFLDEIRDKVGKNPRMAMIYRTWDRMDAEKRDAILAKGDRSIAAIERGEDP